MSNLTSSQLLAIINTVTPVFTGLVFFEYPQLPKQRRYPSVDIREIQPQSPEQTPKIVDQKTRFEINIYIKRSNPTTDTDNLETLERNIVTAVLAATLTTGKLILETETFQRSENIAPNPLNVQGYQSTLTLYFQERAAVIGIIGLQQTLDIGTISALQILGETGSRGRNDTRRANDKGFTKVNKGERTHNRFFEYPYTKSNYDTIDTLIENDAEITITLHEGTQADTVLLGKPAFQNFNVRWDGQKVAILHFEVADYSDS